MKCVHLLVRALLLAPGRRERGREGGEREREGGREGGGSTSNPQITSLLLAHPRIIQVVL